MKFKLRVMDADAQSHQNPVYYSQSSSSSSPYTYFTEQPVRGGYPTGNFSGGLGGPEMFRERFDMRDAIQRELEKERIREEIIAEEMARQHMLEEEVRHELMMERQMMVMRSGGGFPSPYVPLPLPPSHNNLLEPVILHRQPIGLEERIIMSIEEKNARGCGGSGGVGGHPPEIRGFDAVHFQRFADSAVIQGIPTPLLQSSQNEVIPGKPSGKTLTGAKRKQAPPVTGESSGSGSYSDTSRKRITEEWSCGICQVTATSKRGLNEHLQGKKHQLKEAALIAKKTGACHGLGVSTKKPMVKLSVTTVNMSSGGRKSKPIKRSGKNRTSSSTNETLSSTNVLIDLKKEDGDKANGSNDSKKEDGMDVEKKKDKFKFWCEMCKVGAFAEKVMNNHREGKKHTAKLVELLQNGKPAIPFDIKENMEVAGEEVEVKSDKGEEDGDDTSGSI